MAKVQHDPIVNAVPTAEKEHIQVHKVQRVAPGTDGMVKLQESHGALKTVDVADVDLVLGFADGTFIIIPNGALDAIAGTPGKVAFADGDVVDMGDLFKLVGHVEAADAGSLRIISENINTKLAAAGESDEDSDVSSILLSLSNHSASTAPPAPMPKVSSMSTASPIAKGAGNGRFDTESLDSIVPPRIDQPTQYRVGVKVPEIKPPGDITIGVPDIQAQLLVSKEFKVDPSFRSDLPQGATDSSSEAQAHRERIDVTNPAGSTIDRNPDFAAADQWSKTLHLEISGYDSLNSVAIGVVTGGLPPGFTLTDVSGASGTVSFNGNQWIIDPSAFTLQSDGSLTADINVLYDLRSDSATAPFNDTSFQLLVQVDGQSGQFNFQSNGSLFFSYIDPATDADYLGVTSSGQPIFILPARGVGYDIYGNVGVDDISAGAGRDYVNGGDGNDILNGNAGNDTLVGGAGADVLNGGTGSDWASYIDDTSGTLVVSMTTPTDGTGDAFGDTFISIENLQGSDNSDKLIGNTDANRILGEDGNDTIEGMGGQDTLDGGNGTNTLSFEHSITDVTASLTNGLSGVTNTSNSTYTNFTNLLGGAGNDTLIGTSGANTITGGNGNDVLEGLAGADSLDGGIGSDTASYIHSTSNVSASLTNAAGNTNDAAGDTYTSVENLQGTNFNDILEGSSTDNVLSAAIGNDVLYGLAGNDTLNGEDGNDTLHGGAGADSLAGGLGTDTASYITASDLGGGAGVVATLTTGLSGVTATGDAVGDIYSSIEILEGSNFNDLLIGDGLANTLLGGTGSDTLEGLGGADVLNGGTPSGTDANNTASYAHAGTTGGSVGVTASLTTGIVTMTGDASGDTYINIQNLQGSIYNDILIGSSVANVLSGGDGNDTLEGLDGADSLVGGTGSNTASYEHANAAVVASLTTSLVTTAGDANGDTYTDIQNLLGSNFSDLLIGDSADNIINGGGLNGNDTLEGMAGADTLNGGTAGTDTASYAHASVGVLASLSTSIGVTNTGDAAGDIYINIDNLLGSSLDDTLIGDVNANLLTGGDGNDTLEGLNGNDTLNGGDGSDTASYIHASNLVVATLTAGLSGVTVTGDATGDSYISIENLQGSTFNDLLIGDVNANSMDGDAGNDTLEGLGGADALDGGTGTNTASYAHASTGVAASLTGSLISASGDAAGDTYTNIQNLLGSGFADVLIGDTASNTITGGLGNDTLEGLAGADSLDGGSGTDTASYAHAADLGGGVGVVASMTSTFSVGPAVVTTGDAVGDVYTSIEVLEGSAFNDYLIGDGSNNALNGGSGNDTLEGLVGNDTLNGGDGNDTATYIHATGSIATSLASGLITKTGDAIGDVYTSIENLTGSNFADTLIGDNNANTLAGGEADDKLEGLGGADSLDGGNGTDTASYLNATGAVVASMTTSFSAGPAVITTGDAAGDIYNSIEVLEGSIYNDVLIGDGNANSLLGGNGNDTLEGMGGADILDGGSATSTDTATYIHSAAGVVASMTATFATGPAVTTTGDAAGDTYVSIEVLEGSTFDDMLIGNSSANRLSGNEGNDTLEGLGGNDTLDGGNGNDTASYVHSSTAIVASLTTGLVSTQGVDAVGDTYISIENLTGSNNNDQLVGSAVANILTGGDGNDTLEGLDGADVLDGGNGNNTASYEHASGAVVATLTNGLSGVTIGGDAVGDTYIDIQNLYGSAFNDKLIGDSGDNILTSGGGADTLEGLDGADSLVGSAGGSDTASYEHATGVIANGTGIVASLSTVTGVTATGDAVGDTYTSIENLIGSIGNDQLVGDGNANRLDGGDGNDTLEGLNGADALIGGNGTDTATYIHSASGVIASMTSGLVTATGHALGDSYSSIEILEGSNFDDQLIGNIDANTLNGGDGNDTLEGMGGADALNGGIGINLASYEHAGVGVTAVLDTAAALAVTGVAVTATGDAAGDTYTDIQNLRGSIFADRLVGDSNANAIYGGDSGDILEGLDGNDSLYGEAGDDTLVGGVGTDTLDGGSGTDIASYRYSAAITVSLIDPSTNTGEAAGDTYVSIEGLEGGTGNDSLTGNDSSNTLLGGDGNDTLEGLGGADIINGGIGTDTASFANAGVAVVASLTTGLSGVVNAGDAVGDTFINIENLQGSAFADLLAGDSNVNVLSGGDGNDTLEGIGGGDTLNGGNNSDTASYIHATAAVTASLLSNTGTIAGLTADTFIAIENLTGSDFDDTLTGDANLNTIYGGLGNDLINGGNGGGLLSGDGGDDTLIGGTGVDTMAGGTGIDTASFAGLAAGVTVTLNASGNGTATGGSGNDTLTSIENVTGTGNNDTINIGILPTATTGGFIDGGAGTDTLSYSTIGTTVVIANLASGVVNGQVRISNIENLTSASGNDNLTGDANNNILTANDGNDTLDGGDGNDTLFGGNGVDSLTGGLGNDSVDGGAGNDTLFGNDGDDTLNGGAGSDVLDGGIGNNTAAYASGVTVSLTSGLSGVTASGDAVGDTFTNIQNISVAAGNNGIYGDINANILTGGTGNDTLEGLGGNDTISGGTGTNTLTFFHATNGVNVNLNAATTGGIAGLTSSDITGTSTGTDTLTLNTLQNVIGSGYSDLIYGDGNNNVITGNDGDDTVDGGAGNDNIAGGNGNDSLTGGLGNDTLDGGANDDFIDARLGKDVVTGGAGNDTILGSVDAAGGTGFPNRFTSVDSGAGTDTLVLSGFTNNLSYALSTLTGLVTNTEAINIQGDAGTVTTTFALDSASIQSVVGAGTGSTLYVTHGAEDGISIITTGTQSFTSTTIDANDTLYTIYSGANGTGTAVANVHWIT